MGTPAGAPVDPSFMGYLIQGSATSERFCGPLQTFTTFGTVAACCPKATTVLCNYYTTCTNQCTAAGNSCVSQTIYGTYPTQDPHTHFVCAAPGWDWSILFRDIPATTSATLIYSQMTPPPAAASTTTDGSAASTANSSSSPSTTSFPTSKNHTGLIVGVVFGVLAAISLLLVGVLLLRKRQKRWKMQNQIAELEDSSLIGGFNLQNQQPIRQGEANQLNSSSTVVPEGVPAISAVYPSIGEYYAKSNSSTSPRAMFGAIPAAGSIAGGAIDATTANGDVSSGQHDRHYSSGSAGVSPIGNLSADGQGRRPSDFIFSPVPMPISELDAVDSAVRLELPTSVECDIGFMSSPAVSYEGDTANIRGGDKDYDGDGDTTDCSDEPAQVPGTSL